MGSAGVWHHPFTLLLLLITGCRYPQGTGLGLGMAFARELDAIGALPGPIGLVPCAFGGSPLLRVRTELLLDDGRGPGPGERGWAVVAARERQLEDAGRAAPRS